jgi:hypothetical protein
LEVPVTATLTRASPEHALLLRDFANTLDIDEGTDALSEPAALTAWLSDRGLIPGSSGGARAPGNLGAAGTGSEGVPRADRSDLELAITLRTALRAAMRARHHQRPPGGAGATVRTPATAGTAGPGTAGPGTAGPGTAGAADSAGLSGAPGPPSGLATAAANLPLRLAESAGNPVLVPVEGGVRGGLAVLAAAVVASTADRSWERLKICAEDSCQWAFLDSSKNRSKHWCSMQECGNRAKTRAYRARRASGGSAQ